MRSRIAFIFLPVKFYFGIMRYERVIQIAMFVLLYIGVFNGLLSSVTGALLNGTQWLVELIPIFRF